MSADPVGANVVVLQRTLRLLETLDDAQYRHVALPLSTASIGAHVRHVLDHYRLLLAGLAVGLVDYDARERHTPVETDRQAAAAAVRALLADLAALGELAARAPAALSRPLAIRQQCAEPPAGPGVPDGCESTAVRELFFLHSHAVHHHALIAVLARAQGIPLAESFGMAPSTLTWLRQARCAR
jgi:hypothetical protein